MHIEEDTLTALQHITPRFGRTIVVTNQKCIYRGLLTEPQLADIHSHMCALLQQRSIQLTEIYHAPGTDDDPLRKPQTGMGQQAQQDYPEIDFARSIMVGNNVSDMQFGRALGMYTVLLMTTLEQVPEDAAPFIDEQYDSLHDWYASRWSD